MATNLESYAEMLGKVSLAKIAETAGVSLAEVEAWAKAKAGGAPPADETPEKPERINGKKVAVKPPPARKPEVIHVPVTTAISVETPKGKRVRLPVPRSIYRGELARKYASLLKPSEYTVIEFAE
ncbi:MAG TPA: hypothetical protein VEB22_15505 [Phycisphaerales bacterium]|nr:hypothetical protein [Phycisphaerales bacterium]